VYVKFKQYNEPLYLSVEDKLAIYNGGELINDLQYLYLRPMSSMDSEEIEIYRAIIGSLLENSVTDNVPTLYNFLNSKHLDYNGLIFRGLALEATEGMYK
jgi:hypothetical protein